MEIRGVDKQGRQDVKDLNHHELEVNVPLTRLKLEVASWRNHVLRGLD